MDKVEKIIDPSLEERLAEEGRRRRELRNISQRVAKTPINTDSKIKIEDKHAIVSEYKSERIPASRNLPKSVKS